MLQAIYKDPGRITRHLMVQLAFTFFLAGCYEGGGFEANDKGSASMPINDAPEVTLIVDSTTINLNDDVLLEWNAYNADSCTAAGSWSGTKNVSGQQTINALTANSTFAITCTGDAKSVSDSVNVTVVGAPAAPTVGLSASSTNLPFSGSTTLTWSSANASSCSASGGWTGSKNASGSKTINALTADTSFSLSCTGAGGTATDRVDVTVSAPAIAPVVNLSASPTTIGQNGSTTLTWSSSDATGCTASGDWSGSKAVSGSQLVSGLAIDSQFNLVCNGPGGSVNDTVSVTVTAPRPALSFSASPTTIAQNGSTTLTWSSSNATGCTASGDWSGSKAVDGSQLVSGLTIDSQFNLVCNGPGGSVNDTVSVTVAAPAPTLTFSASPGSVSQNGSTTLNWNSTDATSCVASGDWSGNKNASGSESTGTLTIDSQYTLTCSGAGGSVNESVNVTVVLSNNGTALLSWTPPIENADGSTLTDLAGYKIRYGTSPGTYSDTEIINDPGLTSFMIEDLASADWYFVMTSFNSSGIESGYSTEVSKTIN